MGIGTVLLAHRDADLRAWAANLLGRSGFALSIRDHLSSNGVGPGEFAAAIIGASGADLEQALDLASELQARHAVQRCIIFARSSGQEHAIRALRLRVWDYVSWPCREEDLLRTLEGVVAPSDSIDFPILGSSEQVRNLRATILRLAKSDINVLIVGETGTGKELVAEAIHGNSARARRALVSVNCAAIPETLVESELFGYERGAFTGAWASRPGLLRRASGGTVLFDEIGDMNLYAQAKLLRVIERREVLPLGGNLAVPVDIRIIAATHRDLRTLAREDRFREDLYFRLNVAQIYVPALRDHKEDIPVLVRGLLKELNRKRECPIQYVSDEVYDRLSSHDWPGNVRELRNVIEASCVNSCSPKLVAGDLPAEHAVCAHRVPITPPAVASARCGELQQLLQVLSETKWNKSEAARKLHCSRMTLYRKLEKYQIVPV
jgi:DNA-binding NtrC family response regulator